MPWGPGASLPCRRASCHQLRRASWAVTRWPNVVWMMASQTEPPAPNRSPGRRRVLDPHDRMEAGVEAVGVVVGTDQPRHVLQQVRGARSPGPGADPVSVAAHLDGPRARRRVHRPYHPTAVETPGRVTAAGAERATGADQVDGAVDVDSDRVGHDHGVAAASAPASPVAEATARLAGPPVVGLARRRPHEASDADERLGQLVPGDVLAGDRQERSSSSVASLRSELHDGDDLLAPALRRPSARRRRRTPRGGALSAVSTSSANTFSPPVLMRHRVAPEQLDRCRRRGAGPGRRRPRSARRRSRGRSASVLSGSPR